ncbi:hypothetical protein, partial [Pseudonocardia sp. Ae263_Ps1]
GEVSWPLTRSAVEGGDRGTYISLSPSASRPAFTPLVLFSVARTPARHFCVPVDCTTIDMEVSVNRSSVLLASLGSRLRRGVPHRVLTVPFLVAALLLVASTTGAAPASARTTRPDCRNDALGGLDVQYNRVRVFGQVDCREKRGDLPDSIVLSVTLTNDTLASSENNQQTEERSWSAGPIGAELVCIPGHRYHYVITSRVTYEGGLCDFGDCASDPVEIDYCGDFEVPRSNLFCAADSA